MRQGSGYFLRGSWVTNSRGNHRKRLMSLAFHPYLSYEARVSVDFAALKSRSPYFDASEIEQEQIMIIIIIIMIIIIIIIIFQAKLIFTS